MNFYSHRLEDDHYNYRFVTIPAGRVDRIPTDRYLHEDEWRAIGISQQSKGWEHYMSSFASKQKKQLIFIFRRAKGFNPKSEKGWMPPKNENIPNKKDALNIIDQIKIDS